VESSGERGGGMDSFRFLDEDQVMAKASTTSKIPSDHLAYLRRRPFVFSCSTAVFPLDELEALREYGNWLEALAAGTIKPVTGEQEHFLKVDRDEAAPETVCERAWVRLKGRREYEREEGEPAPPPPPPENYGIVEWDHDRCWW
jgi:uncharacterized protein YifE (UPF0438 family)